MNKEKILKAIMELPKVETINPISAMNSINIDDLMSAVDRLNKAPDYNDLLKENKKLHEELECTIGIVEHNRIISEKNKEIHQLKDNWNNLKKWLEKELGYRINPNKDKWLTGVYDAYRETIDKMQEIEQEREDVSE